MPIINKENLTDAEKKILEIHQNSVDYMKDKHVEIKGMMESVHPALREIIAVTDYQEFQDDKDVETDAINDLARHADYKDMSKEDLKLELEAAFELEALILDIEKALNILLQPIEQPA